MLKKTYTKTGRICRVTFELPPDVSAQTASLCGEFNEWDETADPMKRTKKGAFQITKSLPTGQSYRFRYRLDGSRWENDWSADEYVPNVFGQDDSLVSV